MRRREIEGGVVERQARGVAFHEVRVRRCTLARERDQLGHAVDAHDLAHERGERECERTRAAADVDRALVAVREDERAHLLRELGRVLVLARRRPLRGAREALLSHRRRRAAHARDRSRYRTRART